MKLSLMRITIRNLAKWLTLRQSKTIRFYLKMHIKRSKRMVKVAIRASWAWPLKLRGVILQLSKTSKIRESWFMVFNSSLSKSKLERLRNRESLSLNAATLRSITTKSLIFWTRTSPPHTRHYKSSRIPNARNSSLDTWEKWSWRTSMNVWVC